MALTNAGTTGPESETDRVPEPRGASTMVPPVAALPDLLPTDRLTASGMPVRALRDDLRRIANVRNIGSVALCWGQAAVTIGFALVVAHPLAWLVAFVLMGPVHARFAILMHEAAHKLLFTHKRANDVVGRWLGAYPAFVPLELYRRSHFAHHRDEFGPDEPDLNLYAGYPITRASMQRKLVRDLRGSSGWKNLKVLIQAVRREEGFGIARQIAVAQVGVAVVLSVFGVALAGWVGLATYPVFWLGTHLTVWRVVNRLRSIAEHGGMERSKDRRRTTHHVEQSWLARFWIVPFNTGWHLAHHVDMGVPFRNLPALHRELVGSGWVTPDITYPNYRALWRALASRPA